MRRTRTSARIWIVCVVVLVAIDAFGLFVGVSPLLAGSRTTHDVDRADVALQQVAQLRTSLANFQVFAEPHMTLPTVASPADVARAAGFSAAETPQAMAVVRALHGLALTGTASDLATATAAFSTASADLAPVALGAPSAQVATVVAAERAAYARIWTVTATAATQVRRIRNAALTQTAAHLDRGRATLLIVGVFAGAAILFAGVVLGRRARRATRAERADALRQEFETSLQEALDMTKAEPEVFTLAGKALDAQVPGLTVEMLVADSSRAHLHHAVVTHQEARSGCAVVAPMDCPATSRGHTLVFPTSTALNACPYLQDRESGDCSAACVPISIAGKTVGVTHATGPDGQPPTETDIGYLEITSRRTSERIGMLRAFAKSETQASSDPLTGLWNRRSLENRVRDLQRDGIPYALAYGDLDHFKALNDTHGHEAGDQALRLFSRVVRESIRPDDIAARYGGEEFVLVMPDCNTTTAANALERIRENLALSLTTGRVAAFTVSFGLASSNDADTFDDVVAVADHALLAAKAAGRNRVITSVTAVGVATDDSRPAVPAA